MAKHFVNLDALIPREDFEVKSEATSPAVQLSDTMLVTALESTNIFYATLRKPDFQRETSNWEPDKVAELIQSFLEGDLIPSVILWRSPSGNIFTIDGAHRLSAFVAWVRDDYGDGELSIRFFGGFIPEEQQRAAEKTRKLIKSTVGSYQNLKTALQNSQLHNENTVRLAKNLSIYAITLQWVPGEASKAESSYFKINQKATIIDQTELEMIKSRHKPNALATRALIRAGTGHKYWSAFPENVQAEIETIARDMHDALFKPAIETPIKTLDLPVAGRSYSAESVKMVFDLVNYVNTAQSENSQKSMKKAKSKNGLEDDLTGGKTLEFLRAVKKIASRISGTDAGSLGLHPAVYFYGATGRFQPSAFLAVIAFVRELEKNNQFAAFTTIRERFEEFLLKYRHFVNQVGRNYGAGSRGLNAILTMYRVIFSALKNKKSYDKILQELKAQPELRFLREITDEDRQYGRNFSKETKSAVFFREAMKNELRCRICKARLHFRSISMDHIDNPSCYLRDILDRVSSDQTRQSNKTFELTGGTSCPCPIIPQPSTACAMSS